MKSFKFYDEQNQFITDTENTNRCILITSPNKTLIIYELYDVQMFLPETSFWFGVFIIRN